jgi:hypothetical protein
MSLLTRTAIMSRWDELADLDACVVFAGDEVECG